MLCACKQNEHTFTKKAKKIEKQHTKNSEKLSAPLFLLRLHSGSELEYASLSVIYFQCVMSKPLEKCFGESLYGSRHIPRSALCSMDVGRREHVFFMPTTRALNAHIVIPGCS
jgi:hypothetical protein